MSATYTVNGSDLHEIRAQLERIEYQPVIETLGWQMNSVAIALALLTEVERLREVLEDIATDKEIAGDYIRRKARAALPVRGSDQEGGEG